MRTAGTKRAGRQFIGVGVGALILNAEGKVFLARHVSGAPRIMEPGKCTAFGWFALDAMPRPLTAVAEVHVRAYEGKYGAGGLALVAGSPESGGRSSLHRQCGWRDRAPGHEEEMTGAHMSAMCNGGGI